jgi:hypothetical protein
MNNHGKLIEIRNNGKVSIYQLDFDIIKCAGICKTIHGLNLQKYAEDHIIDEYLLDEDIRNSVNKIAVSDALTHIERLVFPAFWIINKTTGERKISWIHNNIDGKWTMMIEGGNPRYVYRPETYISHLYLLNSQQN